MNTSDLMIKRWLSDRPPPSFKFGATLVLPWPWAGGEEGIAVAVQKERRFLRDRFESDAGANTFLARWITAQVDLGLFDLGKLWRVLFFPKPKTGSRCEPGNQ